MQKREQKPPSSRRKTSVRLESFSPGIFTAERSRKAQKWLYQNQEVKINDLQDALENLTSAESPGKKTDGQQGISLTLHLDNEDFPEITITLFRHGGIQYPETVNGKIVAYISRSEAVELMEVVRTLVL